MTDASTALAPLARDEQVPRSKEPLHATVVYDHTQSAAAHLEQLGALYLDDRRVERKRKILLIVLWVLGVPAFLLFPLTFGAAFLPLIPIWYWRHRLGKRDLENRRLHAARFVLEVLEPELKASRPVKVKIDFGGFHKAPREVDARSGSIAPSYTKPWLEMELPLLDGSAVNVAITTRLKRKERRKRKYTKIKERLFDELDLQLRTPRGLRVDALTVEQLKERFGGQHPLLLKGCRVTSRGAAFSFRTPTALRTRLRHGWMGRDLESLLDGRGVLEAIIACHTAVVVEARASGVAA